VVAGLVLGPAEGTTVCAVARCPHIIKKASVAVSGLIAMLARLPWGSEISRDGGFGSCETDQEA
jgi:hypothetical protein